MYVLAYPPNLKTFYKHSSAADSHCAVYFANLDRGGTCRMAVDSNGNLAVNDVASQLRNETTARIEQYLERLDWLIAVVVPDADFMDRIRANTDTTILLCRIAFGVTTGLGIFMARRIAKPILQLSRASRAISQGDLDQTVRVQGATEINVLAQSFNQMAQQLQESFAQLEKNNDDLELRVTQRTAALQASEAKFAAAFRSSPNPMTIATLTEGRFIEVNESFCRLFGYAAEEVVGQTSLELNLFQDPEQRAKITEILQTQQAFSNQEVEFRVRSGAIRTVLLSAELITVDGTLCILWVGHDISDRKATEVALEAATEAAEVANRAKSQFLAHMSHELRNPLNVILGFTQLMLQNGSLTTQQQDYLDTIDASGEHLLTLINDVLEMSKIEAGKTILHETTCDLYELLNWVYQTLNLKARAKGLEMLVERSLDLPRYIHIDECKLRQVLMNLLGNAIKFTQAGKVILRVETANQVNRSAPYALLFEVEDTGVGIAPTELNTLFEPFVQTETGRDSQEGTGLGLPIAQQFVRLMGGEMTVKSQLGAGTMFQFQLPAGAAHEVPASAPRPWVIGLAAGQLPYRILVVEDKPKNRQILVELLTSVGFEVREAENGQGAVDVWQSWLPHLIWMDIRMPILDGLAATRQIKAGNSYHTPVIIAVTGSVFEEDRIAVLSAGCDDFVRKPIRAEIVFDKMAAHLGVRYRYAAIERQTAADIPSCLTPSDLANLPTQWIEQLHQAATNVNAKQILKLLQQLSPAQTELATAITHLVDNFQFDEVVQWTQPRSHNH